MFPDHFGAQMSAGVRAFSKYSRNNWGGRDFRHPAISLSARSDVPA